MNDTGNQDVRIVHHQNLNKRILLALIASSALAGIFIFLLFLFLRRNRKLTISASKSRGTLGIMASILSFETFILIFFKSKIYYGLVKILVMGLIILDFSMMGEE